MGHDFHHVPHHFFPNPPDQCRPLRCNTNHDFASILARARTNNVIEVLQSRDQAARRSGRMPHLLRDLGHRHDLLLIERRQEKKLWKRDVTGRQFLAEMQDKTTLHFQNDAGKLFGVGAELLHAVQGQLGGGDGSGFQRAKAKMLAEGVKRDQ